MSLAYERKSVTLEELYNASYNYVHTRQKGGRQLENECVWAVSRLYSLVDKAQRSFSGISERQLFDVYRWLESALLFYWGIHDVPRLNNIFKLREHMFDEIRETLFYRDISTFISVFNRRIRVVMRILCAPTSPMFQWPMEIVCAVCAQSMQCGIAKGMPFFSDASVRQTYYALRESR